MIFLSNSTTYGSTQNFGLSPTQVTFLVRLGIFPYLRSVRGRSNEYDRIAFGENDNLNFMFYPGFIVILNNLADLNLESSYPSSDISSS